MAPSRATGLHRVVGRDLHSPKVIATVAALSIVAIMAIALPACSQTTTAVSTPPVTTVNTTRPTIGDLPYGPDPLQQIDLYLPEGDGSFPVVLYLHSGGWIAGSHQYVPDFVLDQVDRGVAVAAVDYRLASRADDGTVTDAFPASVEDVDRAVRFVRADAGALGVDPDRIVLAGASAGGHLALLAAAAPGRYTAADLPADLQSVSPDVQGVMAFVAPTDLVTFVDEDNEMAEASLTTFLACPTTESTSCDTALAAEASPATHLGAGAPPAYLVYGANDTLAPAATQGVPIALRWAAARGDTLGVGSAVQLHVVDAGHNLDRDHVDLAALEEWLDAVVR